MPILDTNILLDNNILLIYGHLLMSGIMFLFMQYHKLSHPAVSHLLTLHKISMRSELFNTILLSDQINNTNEERRMAVLTTGFINHP